MNIWLLLDYNLKVDHKTTLIDNYTYLTDNICISQSNLLDHLLNSRVLDEHEVEEIKSQKTESKRIDKLLFIILRTSPEQYESFLEALSESNHQFVCEWIRGKHTSCYNYFKINLADILDCSMVLFYVPRGIFLLNVGCSILNVFSIYKIPYFLYNESQSIKYSWYCLGVLTVEFCDFVQLMSVSYVWVASEVIIFEPMKKRRYGYVLNNSFIAIPCETCDM